MRDENYLIRIVRSQNEFREKIPIFDEGLDDRIIELFKLYVLATFRKNHPDCNDVDILCFREDGKNCVQIFAGNQYQGTSEYTHRGEAWRLASPTHEDAGEKLSLNSCNRYSDGVIPVTFLNTQLK